MRSLAIIVLAGCFGPSPARNQRCDQNGWCPPPESCQSDGVCRASGDPDATPDTLVSPNKMFVLQETIQVSMFDLAELDAICDTKSFARGYGHAKAWLATSGQTAADRLAPASGWVRVDGKPFASSRADLAAGRIFYPPAISIDNNDIRGADLSVATGALGDGTVAPSENCNDWTSGNVRVGKADGGSDSWTSAGVLSCTNSLLLYCFGIDNTAQVRVPPLVPGQKRAFVTKVTYDVPTIATADGACQFEAGAANFRALLATSTMTVKDRFLGVSGPWFRIDGVEVTKDMTSFEAPLNVTVDGQYIAGANNNGAVWFGASRLVETGGPMQNCSDWSDPSGNAAIGDATRSLEPASFSGLLSGVCTGRKARLYCAEF